MEECIETTIMDTLGQHVSSGPKARSRSAWASGPVCVKPAYFTVGSYFAVTGENIEKNRWFSSQEIVVE
jgi:hypothetical protein